MNKILLTALLSLSILSCVSIRFPESVKVDITVPENLDIEKEQVIVDMLKGVSIKRKNIDSIMEFNIIKKDLSSKVSNDISTSVDSVFIGSKKTLIIIDGKEQTNDNIIEILDPEKIATVNVFKDSIAIAKYGVKAKNGVVIIITKQKTN